MKKTFQLQIEGKNPDRVLEAAKHDIRKYLARERRRALPKGVDYWAFDCRIGPCADTAYPVHVAAINRAIDTLVAEGNALFYMEILAKHGHRVFVARTEADSDDAQ